MHSTLHSLFPRATLNHSSPRPVHSGDLSASDAAARPALDVSASISSTTAPTTLLSEGCVGVFECDIAVRGKNQLAEASKKHWSDQLQDVKNRMTSSTLQYTQGRCRKYVARKKSTMNAGEAFVGMNRRGSQLRGPFVSERRDKGDGWVRTSVSRTWWLWLLARVFVC